MKMEPTGFEIAVQREEFRQILMICENSTNMIADSEKVGPKQQAAIVLLLRALIKGSRVMLNELDRQDITMPEEFEIDFDTDLRMLFDAEGKDDPGQQHPH